jgi:purine-cytosine permease-like protein
VDRKPVFEIQDIGIIVSQDFPQVLKDWQPFFSAVAGASVTLAGLLFVSLSLRFDKIRKHPEADFMRLARNSFADFLYVLMLGLIFLVPHPVPVGLAVALFVLGASSAVGLFRVRPAGKYQPSEKKKTGQIFRESALPAVASLGLIVVSVEIMRGDMTSIYALVLVVAALLATASWNAWLILVEEPHPDGASRIES